MTLTEYINQQEPQRMPVVKLINKEVIVAATHTDVMGNVTKSVYINNPHPLVAGIEYCLIGGTLYTTDKHGNAKNRSCFHVIVK